MDQLKDMLSKQALILSLLSEKLQIVNYMVEQLNNSETTFLFQNHFSIFTTHIYLRSAIIDLGALVIDRQKSHKNNFHGLYQNSVFESQLTQGLMASIKNLLIGAAKEIEQIHELRDTAMAHYDLDTPSLSFSVAHLPLVNKLYNVCKQILEIAGKQVEVDFHLGFDYFQSLQKLVKDTDHLKKGARQFPGIVN